ncbi:MAG: UvrB/UvrC motif-containing protein [Alkalispirochaeta sp.]
MLRSLADQSTATDDPKESDPLRDELRDAIDREDYERAAHIRDQLRGFGGHG